MDIGGKNCVERVIERVKKSKLIDEIWLATTYLKIDRSLKKICRSHKIHYFQGSVSNVLSRFYKISKITNAKYIVRITADCPLVDWEIIDDMIKEIKIRKYDYFSNTIQRTFPDGLDIEIFSSSTLKKLTSMQSIPF